MNGRAVIPERSAFTTIIGVNGTRGLHGRKEFHSIRHGGLPRLKQ